MSSVRGRLTSVDLYTAGVLAVGATILLDLAVRLRASELPRPTAVAVALLVCLLVGAVQPALLSRRDDELDEVPLSATFVLAVAVLGPVWLLVPVQVAAVVFGDARRRRGVRRTAFHLAQLVVSAAVTRAVFCGLTGRAYLGDDRAFAMEELAPALLAGLVFFLLDNGLPSTLTGLRQRRPLVPHLRRDLREQLATTGVLLSFAPVVVVACQFSLLTLPLMLLPIAAVHRSARLVEERQRQALVDELTGLPNRLHVQERTTAALEDAERTGACTAVLLIDLDHFKDINDTLGHYVGDQLLREVGTRLRASLRDGDFVARLGGDEFAVLATDLHGRDGAEEVGRRVVTALAQPFTVDGVRLDVQATVGIALAPEHGTDVTALMQRADVALYAAKEHRGCVAVYRPEDDEHSLEKLALLGQLREGVGAGQLRVHYQPKCDAASGRLVGLEALVRWEHPTRGLLAPDEFIGIAENTGLIGPLTLEVLDQSLQTARRLRDQGNPLGVAVNLSVRLLTDLDLPRQVAGLLGRWGVPPEVLTLEVTETSIMADPSRTMTVLGLLRDLGVVLSIDDFGTGYSSLSYLKRLEANELKIDRSFVHAMTTNSNDAVIVRSTIELGHNLGLKLVAEGVEDAATWSMLTALGCDVIQGYHLSRPLPPDALDTWIRSYPHRVRSPVTVAS